MMFSLATDYQTLLEHHRRDPDDEGIRALLKRTLLELIIAWDDHRYQTERDYA
jgi:hypothetical protein